MLCTTLLFTIGQGAQTTAALGDDEDDDDDEPAEDMEAFEESGMLEEEDTVRYSF